jgi:hypothetical protein
VILWKKKCYTVIIFARKVKYFVSKMSKNRRIPLQDTNTAQFYLLNNDLRTRKKSVSQSPDRSAAMVNKNALIAVKQWPLQCTGVARWFIFKPKITIWVNFGRPCPGGVV